MNATEETILANTAETATADTETTTNEMEIATLEIDLQMAVLATTTTEEDIIKIYIKGTDILKEMKLRS